MNPQEQCQEASDRPFDGVGEEGGSGLLRCGNA